MEQTLEKEFLFFSMKHKCEITSAYLMHMYVQRERGKGTVAVDEQDLTKEAETFAYSKVKEFMLNGTLNEEYERAWEFITPFLPC